MIEKARTNDALDAHMQETGIDPAVDLDVQHFSNQIKIAEMIYAARKQAGLTQRQLAEAIGTEEEVISQLEDADYEGHALAMLERIAAALHSKVEIRLVPDAAKAVG